MGMLYLSVVSLCMLVVALLRPHDAAAQGFTIGAGPGTGSIPRALAPLCGSARRLNGWGISGRAGFTAGPVRLGGLLDFLGRWGITEVASCVPRSGLSVDSVFARANNSATSAALWSWIPVGSLLRVGAEAGTVISHDSWFVGPTLGAQADRVGIEVSARRYASRFDEVVRNYGSGTTVEVSRSRRSERSWGLIARVMFYTRAGRF